MEKLAVFGGAPTLSLGEYIRWPVITEADKSAVLKVLERGILSGPFAPEVVAFEEEFSEYLGIKHSLTTNSGTAALHMGLAALGVGPGDEVICPAYTFVATAMAVLHQNAIPVFVDIENETFGMDPSLLKRAITPRTKAIVPVHIHGAPCKIEAICDIAAEAQIPVLEDACQAHGAMVKGKKVGTFGAAAAFSLQSSKNLACGEGGLLVTDSEELLNRANSVRVFGEALRVADRASFDELHPLDAKRAYDSIVPGWMYRTNEMSAALGRSQLKTLDEWNRRANQNAAFLNLILKSLPGIEVPRLDPDRVGNIHKYRVRFFPREIGIEAPVKEVREALLWGLRAEGVETVLWQSMPVPGQRLFREKIGFGGGCPWDRGNPVNYALEQFPETTRLLDGSLCLFSQSYPIASQSQEVVLKVADCFVRVWSQIGDILEKKRKVSGDGARLEREVPRSG